MRDKRETEEAVRLFAGTVYGIAVSHTASRNDADDVFQETFLAFHCSGKRFADNEHRKAWLIRTAVNMARRITAGKWRKAVQLDENTPAERFEFRTDEQNDIADAVRSLPDKYRTVVWLHYFEDMSVKQLAAALGIRESTAKSRLMRARGMLSGILGKEWSDHE